eukprot:6497325-Alexandrium_andersonii.AAC.1
MPQVFVRSVTVAWRPAKPTGGGVDCQHHELSSTCGRVPRRVRACRELSSVWIVLKTQSVLLSSITLARVALLFAQLLSRGHG